jgi:hypothetical protein
LISDDIFLLKTPGFPICPVKIFPTFTHLRISKRILKAITTRKNLEEDLSHPHGKP